MYKGLNYENKNIKLNITTAKPVTEGFPLSGIWCQHGTPLWQEGEGGRSISVTVLFSPPKFSGSFPAPKAFLLTISNNTLKIQSPSFLCLALCPKRLTPGDFLTQPLLPPGLQIVGFVGCMCRSSEERKGGMLEFTFLILTLICLCFWQWLQSPLDYCTCCVALSMVSVLTGFQ